MKIQKVLVLCLTGFVLLSSTVFANTVYASSTFDEGKSAQTNESGIEGVPVQSTIPKIQADTVNMVTPGQKFSVILEENASTGYSWNYTANRDAFQLVNETIQNTSSGNSGGEPIIGAPSQRIWTFTAGKEGIYTLQFFYSRPWEKSTPPCKTMAYTIEIIEEPDTDAVNVR